MSVRWKPTGDVLMFREDEFSWQGSIAEDEFVFVRCEKDDTRRMTDLSISTLSIEQVAQLLVEFFHASNCLSLPGRGEILLPKLVGGLSLAEMQIALASALRTAGAIEVKFTTPIGRDASKSISVAHYSN